MRAPLCHAAPMTRLLLPSFLAACAAVCTLAAQEAKPAAPLAPAPAKPAPEPRPGDPFVRDANTPKVPAPPVPSTFHALIVETYVLPTAELATIFAQEALDAARHQRVVALHAAGKARLTELTANSARSGQRCAVESVDQVKYGTEFNSAASLDDVPTPTAFEVRNTGISWESELTIGPDGQHAQMEFALKRTSLLGLREYSYPAGDPPVAFPSFSVSTMSGSSELRIGEPVLLGSASTPRDAGAESWVTFATAKPMKTDPLAKAGKTLPARLSIELSLYSLERTQARQILAEAAAPGEIHRRVAALAAEGKVQLDRLVVCPAVSGQRSVTEQGSEFRYPTEFDPGGRENLTLENTHRTVSTSTKRPTGKAGANEEASSKETERTETTENTTRSVADPKGARTPGFPTAFETRNLGIHIEAEPVIGEAGLGEMSLVLSEVRNLGTLKVAGVAAKYPFQPLFETRQTTQTAPLVHGVQVFIGTLNAPPENGVNDRKDDGRTVLVFVRLNGGQP